MKKTILPAILALFILSANSSVFSQDPHSLDRPNELYGGYGAFSVYYFTGNISHDYQYADSYYYYSDENDPSSAGTFFLGYNRQVNKVISVGVVFSYMHTTNTLSGYYSYYDSVTSIGTTKDNLLSGLSKVNFTYMNKPFLKLYSGVAIGVTIDLNKATIDGREYTDRKIMPAGQLTLFGIRAGKALGGFLEFGVGTNGIVTAGISYKIKD
jgi:hypothetical protein